MKVVILGAGVIGVTSAYYLAKAGFEVTVIERQPGAGLETSFTNAGEVSTRGVELDAISPTHDGYAAGDRPPVTRARPAWAAWSRASRIRWSSASSDDWG